VVGRVFTNSCIVLLVLAACEGPTPQYGVADPPEQDSAIATSATGDGPAEPGQSSPPSPGPRASAATPPPKPAAPGVQDIAPAAGPPTAAAPIPPAASPAPSPPPPAKPAIDDNPERLMGLGAAELVAVLGDPRFVRRDSSAQLWRYRHKNCILDLFLYRGTGRPEYFVSHIEARHHKGGTAVKRDCFGALLLERRDREAS
jgi:hypothetical protein